MYTVDKPPKLDLQDDGRSNQMTPSLKEQLKSHSDSRNKMYRDQMRQMNESSQVNPSYYDYLSRGGNHFDS